MMNSFAPPEYTDPIKELIASQPPTPHLASDSAGVLLSGALDNETQFIHLYELFKPSLKSSEEYDMGMLVGTYFGKNSLNDLNKHILSDWAGQLNHGGLFSVHARQYGNPIINNIAIQQFKTQEQWLSLANILLYRDNYYQNNYAKIKNIFDKYIVLKKQPNNKVKTVAGITNFLYTAAHRNPTIFDHFLDDYAWAGVFILTSKNADLVGKFFARASEKQIVQALEHEKLIPGLKKFKPKIFIEKNYQNEKIRQLWGNADYVLSLIRYAMDFSTSMNNPEKMPLALTFLELFEKNIHSVSDIVGFNKKTNEDFVEFMVQVNNVKHKPNSGATFSQTWKSYLNFDSITWSKQKIWMKLDKIVKQNNVTYLPKVKI